MQGDHLRVQQGFMGFQVKGSGLCELLSILT